MKRLRITLTWLGSLVSFTVILLGLTECSLKRMEAAPASPTPAMAPDAAQARVQLLTQAWQTENARINRNNYEKLLQTGDDWVWRTEAYPVSEKRVLPKRILVMGDSFVWGDGYANMNDTWWRQLQRELLQRGYHDVEVIAAGVNGASTHAQYDNAVKILPRYSPDLVIWGYVTNDPDEGLVKQLNYGILAEDNVVRFHNNLAQQRILPRVNFQLEQLRRQKLLKTLPQDELGYEYNEWELKLLEPANLAHYKTTVQSVADLMRSSQLPFFFMTLPNSAFEGFRLRYAAVKPLFAEAHVPFHDLLDVFIAQFGSGQALPNNLGWGINPSNGHPGVISTRFFARQAADIMEREHAAVLGSKGEPQTHGPPVINDWMPARLAVRRLSPTRLEFNYPLESDELLRMPDEKTYVQFSLSLPAHLRRIRLSGSQLASGSLALTRADPVTGIDYHVVQRLGEMTGSALEWIPAEAARDGINTLRISASFTGPDRTVSLELEP